MERLRARAGPCYKKLFITKEEKIRAKIADIMRA
jgi:hypothetical protein